MPRQGSQKVASGVSDVVKRKEPEWWALAPGIAKDLTGATAIVASWMESPEVFWFATDLGLVVVSERRPSGWVLDLTLWRDVHDVELRVEAVYLDTRPGPGSQVHAEYRMSIQLPHLDVVGTGMAARAFCLAVVRLASATSTRDASVAEEPDEEAAGP